MKSFLRVLFSALVVVALCAPALADDRGHGAIYYSPSGHRLGWARSLESDDSAKRTALAECRGGQFDAETMQRFNAKTAGPYATAANFVPMNVAVNDCVFINKFDSSANHQCLGFGYDDNGAYTENGERWSDYASTQNALRRWAHSLIVCNDDRSVSGGISGFLDRLAKALSTPTPAPYVAPTPAPYFAPTPAPYAAPTYPPSNGSQSGLSPSSIRFTNNYSDAVSFTLKCPNETQPHLYTVDQRVSQTINAGDWNQNCTQFNIAITVDDGNGGSTEVDHLLNGGVTYELYADIARKALDVRPLHAPMLVTNGTQQSITYTVLCPDQQSYPVTVAPGETNSTGLPCPAGQISISTGNDSNRVVKQFAVKDGRAYTIQLDQAAQLFILVPTPAR